MSLFNFLRKKKKKETLKVVEILQHGDLARKDEIKYGIGYIVSVSHNVEVSYITFPPKLKKYGFDLPHDSLLIAEIRGGNVWPSRDGSSESLGEGLLSEENKVIEIFKISELEKALNFCLTKSHDFAKDFIERGYTFTDKSKERLKIYGGLKDET